MAFKEKILIWYERFFQGKDVNWDEFFLLEPNPVALSDEIMRLSEEALVSQHKAKFQELFKQATEAMQHHYSVARINGMANMRIILRSLCSKRFHDFGYVIGFMADLSSIDSFMKRLIDNIKSIFISDLNSRLSEETLHFCVCLASLTENTNQNLLLHHFMRKDLCELLFSLLQYPNTHYPSSFVVSILISYRKYEWTNPFAAHLISMNSPAIFEMTCLKLKETCGDWISQYNGSTSNLKSEVISANPVSFIMTVFRFTASASNTSTPPSPHSPHLLLFYEFVHSCPAFLGYFASNSVGIQAFGSLLELSTHLFQDTPDLNVLTYSKLCLICIRIIVQNSGVSRIIMNSTVHLDLCRAKPPVLPTTGSQHIPLACFFLDAMTVYLQHNLRRKFQTDMFRLVVDSIQLLIIQLHANHVRLHHHWQYFYNALMGVIKYIVSHPSTTWQLPNVRYVLSASISIFNLVITHGDSFLPDTISYDSCYYCIVLHAEILDKLRDLFVGEVLSPTGTKRTANDLTNILAICSHFLPLITAKDTLNSNSMTPEHVIKVIRMHYETIELKITKLPHVLAYNEKDDIAFFRILSRLLSGQLRKACEATSRTCGADSASEITSTSDRKGSWGGSTDLGGL